MIDTKLLRQKILDLAIRGKLVPQDPADEPASELLKKIKAEKEALVKAGKIKKDKHESFIFKGDDNRYYETIDGKTTDITDEIPFDLPESWCWCRLNHVALLADGDWIESKDQAHAGFRLIQTGNIGKCEFLPHDERARYISKETFSKLNCTEIFPGDCLISRLPDPLGRACIVPFSHERMITAVDCTITRPFKTVLFTLYFMYFTGTTIYSEYVEKNATGSTRKRISRANLDKTLLPLPPLAEQKRIVSQIESLLNYVDIIDTNAEELDKSITLAKQKILDLAIRGKLVPQDPTEEPASELLKKIKAEKEALVKAGKLKKDKHESFIFKSDDNCYHENIDGKVTDITDEIPFNLPESWCWCRLKTFAIITTGATPSTNIPDYYGGNIPFVKPPDLGEDKYIGKTAENLTKLGATKSRIVPPKSICVCCIGSLGKSSIATDYVCTNQQINSITTSANEKFVYYLCNSSYFIAALQSMATAITIALVNKSRMEQILIPLPPLAEQKRIVSHVEKLFSVLETMRG